MYAIWVHLLGLFCRGVSIAAGTLPRLKGKSVPHIERILASRGFVRTNPANPRNQRWGHPDGAEVQIHAYGNMTTGPHRSGNNAHVHKSIGRRGSPGTVELDDRGHPTTNPDDLHIGIRNPPAYPAITRRPHGAGTIP